jgi:hypothetical protein
MYKYNDNEWINNIIRYYEFNYAAAGILFTISILLSYYTDKRYINGLFTLWLSTLVTWYGHYFLHKYPNTSIAKFHNYTHHSKFGKTFLGKFLEYTINEMFFFGGGILWILVLLLHNYSGVYYLNPYIIMWWTISVPLVHEIYYHQTSKTNIHQLHHKDHLKSLGPDIWDVILKTKHHDTHMEDETSIGLILLIWCILYLFIIKLFKNTL